MNSTPSDEHFAHLLSTAIEAFVTIPSLIIYLLVVSVILANRHEFAGMPYYTLLLSLALSDCVLLNEVILYNLPAMLLQQSLFGLEFERTVGALCCSQYYAATTCATVIAINRYVAVCRYESYGQVFGKRTTILWLMFIWVFSACIATTQRLPMFGQRFYVESFGWGYDMTRPWNKYFIRFEIGYVLVVTIIILACYIPILVNPYWTKIEQMTVAEKQNRNVQRKMALQFGIVLVALVTASLSFVVIPLFTENRWALLSITVANAIYNGCNPFVYLVFNLTVREHFLRTIFRRGAKNAQVWTTVVSLEPLALCR